MCGGVINLTISLYLSVNGVQGGESPLSAACHSDFDPLGGVVIFRADVFQMLAAEDPMI